MGVADSLMHEEEEEGEKKKGRKHSQLNQNKGWRHEKGAVKPKHCQVKIDLPDKSDPHSDDRYTPRMMGGRSDQVKKRGGGRGNQEEQRSGEETERKPRER